MQNIFAWKMERWRAFGFSCFFFMPLFAHEHRTSSPKLHPGVGRNRIASFVYIEAKRILLDECAI